MEEKTAKRIGCGSVILLYWIAFSGLIFALFGCTTTKYVPIETVRTEYVQADTAEIYNRLKQIFETQKQSEQRTDSLVDTNKETIVVNEQGDTTRYESVRVIYRSTNKERELERVIEQKDSLIGELRTQSLSAKVDSVAVPYPVEKELTVWQRTKVEWGGWAFALLAVIFVVWIRRR